MQGKTPSPARSPTDALIDLKVRCRLRRQVPICWFDLRPVIRLRIAVIPQRWPARWADVRGLRVDPDVISRPASPYGKKCRPAAKAHRRNGSARTRRATRASQISSAICRASCRSKSRRAKADTGPGRHFRRRIENAHANCDKTPVARALKQTPKAPAGAWHSTCKTSCTQVWMLQIGATRNKSQAQCGQHAARLKPGSA